MAFLFLPPSSPIYWVSHLAVVCMIKFEQEFQAAHQRLKELRWNANHSPPAAKADLLTEALEEFSSVLERLSVIKEELNLTTQELNVTLEELNLTTQELNITTEELRCQNEELQAAHQTLAKERDRYQELFEFAPDSYLVTDRRGVIQEANRRAAALLNVAQEFLVGKPLTVFVPLKERKPFFTQLIQLTQLRSFKNWEMRLQPRHGKPLPMSISLSAITNPEDELIGWRWLIRDIADRNRLHTPHSRSHTLASGLPRQSADLLIR